MNLNPPQTVECGGELDAALDQIPNGPGVFLIWPEAGEPYLARTGMLKRRLRRLLPQGDRASKLLNLRSLARRIEFWQTASRLESSLTLYHLARLHFPATYPRMLKLATPCYVRLLLANPFPRTQVSTRLSATGISYGPFRARSIAEEFEHELLDLFQIRRCQEDLEPSPQHSGCIYGEMNLCLRPCQQVVGVEEYATEASRMAEFLSTGGRSMIDSITSARDRLSGEMNFEEAARQHRRLEKVEQTLKLRDELACSVDRLHGVAVTQAVEPDAAELWWCAGGCWQDPQRFRFQQMEGKSIDERLRQLVPAIQLRGAGVREMQEHLAILTRWYHSSWRDGEWIPFESLDKPPFRKIVRAISRVVSEKA